MDVDKWPDDDFDDSEFLDDVCEGCGSDGMDGGYCPLCCENGGWYSPGTEDCDFCPHDSECAELQRNR